MEFCLCAFTEKPKPTSLKVLNWVNPIQRSDSPFPSGPVEAESHRHSESERSYVGKAGLPGRGRRWWRHWVSTLRVPRPGTAPGRQHRARDCSAGVVRATGNPSWSNFALVVPPLPPAPAPAAQSPPPPATPHAEEQQKVAQWMDPLSKPPPPERGAGPGGAGDPTLTHSAVPPLRPGPRPRPGGCARVPAERQKPPPSPAGMGRWDRVSRVSRGVPGGAGLWCTAPRAAPGVSRDSGGPRVPEVARAARRLLRDLGRRLARAWRRAVRCAGSGRARQERSWARMDGALGRLRAETLEMRSQNHQLAVTLLDLNIKMQQLKLAHRLEIASESQSPEDNAVNWEDGKVGLEI
ncbi:alanine and arginine-rich domain-containing protein [Cavia porcellus]|uniref:alanine and arginine-rich domain-containing protein n=1 Tax=Cavia porcellus TaxID=10141 RepID=UPI002FE2AEF6